MRERQSVPFFAAEVIVLILLVFHEHAMRPIVSYDDITTTDTSPSQPYPASSNHSHPPFKRRKTNGKPAPSQAQVQHWDDPGVPTAEMSYEDTVTVVESTSTYVSHEKDAVEEEEEESRELTHEDIWDDSALVDAWESAMAEYEVCVVYYTRESVIIDRPYKAFHGTGKSWKEEPVTKKSPLCVHVSS